MSKFILIQNDGEIEANSFELIGASTKRDEKGKIGFFGSGLKYSIAYMMRKGIGFRVFSGTQEYIFTTQPEVLKDKTFDRICINGKPTSFTTSMGPTWTQDWFVLREIYCNALDEGNCVLVPETDIVQPSAGKTRIYIELTPTLEQVAKNWDRYFSVDRTPLFETKSEVYTCYLGGGDGAFSQKAAIYSKTDGTIYRRGIRVYENKDLLFDYGFQHVDINEDRTARNASGIGFAIRNIMAHFDCEWYVRSVLRTADYERPSAEYNALSYPEVEDAFSDHWVTFSQNNLLVVKEISARYADEVSESKKEVFYLPASFARQLKKSQPETIILGMSNIAAGCAYDEVLATPKMQFLLKEVLASLSEMNYTVPFEIKSVEFNDLDVMGAADIKTKTILIDRRTFDKGRRELALTIMEETEHIRSECKDETRSFQTHIFSRWLSTMEESNGVFL